MIGLADAGRPAEGMAGVLRAERRAVIDFWQDAHGPDGEADPASIEPCEVSRRVEGVRRTVRVESPAALVPATNLANALLSRWQRITAEAADAIEFELAEGDAIWSGVLLPQKASTGLVTEVRAIASVRRRVACPADARFALAPMPRARRAGASPWSMPASGAGSLLHRPDAIPTPVPLRLEAARTWAALTSGMRGGARARGLRATLGAAYDVLLGLRDDPRALPDAGETGGLADLPRMVAGLVCETRLEGDRAGFEIALTGAVAMRLDRDGFVALLESGFEGWGDVARGAERAAPDASTPELRLRGIDHGRLLSRRVASGEGVRPRANAA